MKKVLFILLSCFLVLGACGNNDKNTEKVSEDKPQFKNDTLVLDQAVLKLMILLFLMTKIQVINY